MKVMLRVATTYKIKFKTKKIRKSEICFVI
jgi:hypothetical protein